MSKLYEMATNSEDWPLSKIIYSWPDVRNTSEKEFTFLNCVGLPVPHLDSIIQRKMMTEDEIRMYMLFAWHFCNDKKEPG